MDERKEFEKAIEIAEVWQNESALYRYMLEVAKVAGFSSITDAITVAKASRAALAATQAEPVGEITQDDVLGWHFKPYKHWLDIGYGAKLYAAPVLETATQAPDPEETPVELWHGDRKVSIYRDIVLREWGPNIQTEMSDEPRTLQSVCNAVDWLYAAPDSSEKEE